MLKTVILPELERPEFFLKPTDNFFNFNEFKEKDDNDNLCLEPFDKGLNFFKKIKNYLKSLIKFKFNKIKIL